MPDPAFAAPNPTLPALSAPFAARPSPGAGPAYWIVVYRNGLDALIFADLDEALGWIAVEGQYRARPEVREIIERKADGSVIRHDEETLDGWCYDREIALDAERADARWLRSPQAMGR